MKSLHEHGEINYSHEIKHKEIAESNISDEERKVHSIYLTHNFLLVKNN